jgi:hypothetical protein
VAGGRYFDAYGNACGTDVVPTGGLTQGGLVPGTTLLQGVYESPAYQMEIGQPLSGAVASQDPNATSVIGEPNRIMVGAGTAGQGITHSATLGGLSGYFHAFIGVGGQAQTTLPSRLTVSVVVDGKTLYTDSSIAGMTEITVPFTAGSSGTLSVTLNTSLPTAFDVSDLAWYVWPATLDAQMQSPLFLPSSRFVVDSDAWAMVHAGGFSAPLETLLASNPAGPFTEFTNISETNLLATSAISTYATEVAVFNPEYAIFDSQINELAGILAAADTPAQLSSTIESLMALATADETTAVYLRSLETGNYEQANAIDLAEQQFNTISATPPAP